MLHRSVCDAPSASSKKKLVLEQQQKKYFLTKLVIASRFKKMATAVFVKFRSQNQGFLSIEN